MGASSDDRPWSIVQLETSPELECTSPGMGTCLHVPLQLAALFLQASILLLEHGNIGFQGTPLGIYLGLLLAGRGSLGPQVRKACLRSICCMLWAGYCGVPCCCQMIPQHHCSASPTIPLEGR